MRAIRYMRKFPLLLIIFIFSSISAMAQTDMDAIMMFKHNFCSGAVYGYSSWDHYWEGKNKRDNANLGTVSTQNYAVMGNYGINNQLNVLFGIPYVKTKASAGQLHPMKGI